MVDLKNSLKNKSNTELHEWIALHSHDQDAAEYIAGIEELMRRNEAPVRKREGIVMAAAFLAIIAIVTVIIFTYQ